MLLPWRYPADISIYKRKSLTGKKLDQKEKEKEKDIAEKKNLIFLYTRSRRKEKSGINNNFM